MKNKAEHTTTKIYKDIVKRSERRHNHQIINHLVRTDPYNEDIVLDDSFNKDFSWGNVKLSPIKKFFKSKVGEKFSDVFIDFFNKVNRHDITDTKLKTHKYLYDIVDTSGFQEFIDKLSDDHDPSSDDTNSVVEAFKAYNPRSNTFYLYFVDEDGILRDSKDIDKYRPLSRITDQDMNLAVKFLSNRVIAVDNDKMYWCYPKDGIYEFRYTKPKKFSNDYKISIFLECYGKHVSEIRYRYYEESAGYFVPYNFYSRANHWVEKDYVENYVARQELSEQDIIHFNKFPDEVKEIILKLGKGISIG